MTFEIPLRSSLDRVQLGKKRPGYLRQRFEGECAGSEFVDPSSGSSMFGSMKGLSFSTRSAHGHGPDGAACLCAARGIRGGIVLELGDTSGSKMVRAFMLVVVGIEREWSPVQVGRNI